MPRSARRARVEGRVEGRRVAREAGAELGRRIRQARTRRRWSQRVLGEKVGLSSARISQIETGHGHAVPLEMWFALAHVLAIPLRVELMRDAADEPLDAGHLKLQELVLKIGRQAGIGRQFELPTRPADPSRSIDVCLRDDRRRLLVINECWNTFGNVNASVRSTRRKIAEAAELAVAIGGEGGPYRVTACWIVRDTRANRALIARYPEVFAATFTGSSAQWVRALHGLAEPPAELGLVWSDLHAKRVFAWRKR